MTTTGVMAPHAATLWTLQDAREVVAALNKAVRGFDFHVALGGGVVNRGYSLKDIDLYVLPVYIKGREFTDAEWNALDRILESFFGPPEDMRAASVSEHAYGRCFRAERIYNAAGRRVDLFIVEPK